MMRLEPFMLGSLVATSVAVSDSFHNLRVNYRCELVGRLEQIHSSGDPASDRDRFLAVTVPEHPHGYVQCIFHDTLSALYCEAASGYWFDAEGAPRTFRQPQQAIEALANMGFDTDDSAGNFSIDLPLATDPDFNALADFILRALHDGYGARGERQLQFNAPFAPGTPTSCIPVS